MKPAEHAHPIDRLPVHPNKCESPAIAMLTPPIACRRALTLEFAASLSFYFCSFFGRSTAQKESRHGARVRIGRRVQLVDSTLREPINSQHLFQHLESCQPTPIPGPGMGPGTWHGARAACPRPTHTSYCTAVRATAHAAAAETV